MSGEVFTCEVVTTGAGQVVALRGELDMSGADEVREVLLASSARMVVVDLAGLTFIDSSGLTALVHGRNAIIDRGGALSVRGACKDVRRVFEITGLSALLTDG